MRIKATVLVLVVILIAVIAFNYYNLMPKGIVTASVVEKSEGILLRYERIRYPSMAIVSGSGTDVGFDIGDEHLNFGLIPVGGGGKRFLNIENQESRTINIKLNAYGNISEFVSFNMNNFILQPGENVEVEVSFDTDDMTEEGEYSGEIDVTKTVSKNIVGDLFLGWF
ncbi:MAG: hypothetical protein JSW41_05245 [Candidatus Aenigmatarchaeota archaeon]|nr:MAG: hypothetical protein JSW41_05245 [Candidatus Aenigmarchaeota archaeon]